MNDARTLWMWMVAALFSVSMTACKPQTGTSFRDLQYPVETTVVTVGNAEVAFSDQGSGERTLVLLHGLGSYMPVWKNNFGALAQNYRVVAIDLPGYGKSSKQNFEYSMEFFARVVHGVIATLDLPRVTLVGHSMGGQIAMTYALRYPGEVEALVLTSPAGLEEFDDGEARWLAAAVTPEFTCKATPEAIYERTVTNFHKMPRDASFMVDDRIRVIGGDDFEAYCVAVSRSVSAMLDGPVADRLGEIQVPVLVVFGKDDQLIPNPFLHGGSTERLAKKSVERFPKAELVVLDKAGHMAQFEQSVAWNAAVLGFLGDDPGPAPTPDVPGPRPTRDGVIPLYDPGDDPENHAAPVQREPDPEPDPNPEPEPEPEPEPALEPDAKEKGPTP